MRHRYAFTAVSGIIVAALIASTSVQAQDDGPVTAGGNPNVRQAKIDMIQDELKTEIQEMKERAERAAQAKKAKASKSKKAWRPKSGAAPRITEFWDDVPLAGKASVRTTERTADPARIALIPTNVQHNNKVGDGVSTAQSENSIAMDGQYGIASWNDGLGPSLQGMAYTTNGGASWTDIGALPTNATITTWFGDPVCAVNTTTHEFYVVGFGTALQQIAMCKITFPGGVFTISAPILVHQRTGTDQIDKPWFAVDPNNGNLYASWTNFTAGTNRIEFKRSTTGGASWDPVIFINAPASNGLVQGSRPQVGPGGEVYVVWYEIGPIDADFAKIRKSVDNGVTFGAEATAVSYFTNFGTGAPGFNRLRSIDNPSIGVDNSSGPNSGRIYVAVNETINWYDDPLGGGGPKSEVESNGTIATATPFTAGQRLRGSLAAASPSPDYWSFPATQGTTYIFWCDSLAAMFYTMRIFCTDGVTSIAQSGDNTGCPGSQSFIVWTAPTTATYYMRMATVAGNVAGCPTNTFGGYRVQTGVNSNPGAGAEVARDHRDIFVAYSDNSTTWTKVRANDDPAYYDDFLPEVQVACDGYPYVLWYDWRDSPANCGGSSASYAARSTDGGATYAANQRIASVLTNWNTAASNLTPNMGDYIGLHAYGKGSWIAMAWGDGRLGDVDEFGACAACEFTLTNCPPNQVVIAPPFGVYTLNLSATLNNLNILYGNTYGLSVTTSRGWSTNVAASTNVIANGSTVVNYSVDVPDTAASGPATVCLIATLNGTAQAETCCVTLTIDHPVAALASVISASAHPGLADVSWMVSSSSPVTVYRTRDGMAWDRLGSVSPDGTGRVQYRDATVTAGQRYGYRLGVLSSGHEVAAGDVWVDVPAGASFALRPLQNPASGGVLTVSFSLPKNGPATLEILDLGGRRLVREDVSGFGAGSHVLTLRQLDSKLGEGVYMVRLTQAGRSITSKVSVIH